MWIARFHNYVFRFSDPAIFWTKRLSCFRIVIFAWSLCLIWCPSSRFSSSSQWVHPSGQNTNFYLIIFLIYSPPTQFTHTWHTPLDRKNFFFTRNVEFIDLYSVYTIPGRCTSLYIPPGRNLHSSHVDRYGTICGPDPTNAAYDWRHFEFVLSYSASRPVALVPCLRNCTSSIVLACSGNYSKNRSSTGVLKRFHAAGQFQS